MRKLAKRLVSPDTGLVCPDHWAGPDWVLTDGPAVAELCATAGFAPDPQQQLGLDMIFAVGPDGLPASFSFCVICCRQNLKTGLFKQAAIGWLYVTDERKVVWSSHEMTTTLDAQKELGDLMLGSPALRRRMLKQKNDGIYADNGGERIELATGQQILFKARRDGSGRGLSGDKTILDEAFALKPSHVGSLIPTMAARPNAQVIYGSSAGKADSDVLRDVRDRGRAGASPRLSYLEWLAERRDCEDPDCTHPKDAAARGVRCALDDPELWAKANPTITTGRITLQRIADFRQELPAEEFMRECLGWWDEQDAAATPPAIDLRSWQHEALVRPQTPAPARAVVVLAVAPDRSRSAIGVVGPAVAPDVEAGRLLLMAEVRSGYAWVAPALTKLRSRIDVAEVSLHPSTQAGVLIPSLQAEGIEFEKLTHSDLSRGCTALQNAVPTERVVHLGQAEVAAAIRVARTRWVREVEVWDLRNDMAGISTPAVALGTALHRWDLLNSKPTADPPKPRRAAVRESGSRRRRAKRPAEMAF